MPDFPSLNDLLRIGRDEALLANKNLTSTVTDSAGTDANAYLAAAAAVGQELVAQLTNAFASVFSDSATGQDLDKYVFDRFSLTRKPAGAGLTSVVFSCSALVSALSLPSGILVASADGIQYVTVVATSMPIGATTSSAIQARAVLAGLSQAVSANVLVNIVSTISGAPSDLTVTNPLASTGADDEESDDSLRDRARLFFTTARRGTLKAIEAGALAVAGIRSARAIEVLDAAGRPARTVQLVVTDAFTDKFADLGISPASYEAQSQAISTSVFNALSDVRPAGISVEVIVAQVVLQTVTLQLAFQAGSNVNEVAENCRAAAVNYVNNLRPGDTLYVVALQAAVAQVAGLSVTGNEVQSPVGDVIPTPLQVLRTTLELVSAGAVATGQTFSSLFNPDNFVES